jgi:putative hydroxymethylpyrimidine transporter CytX
MPAQGSCNSGALLLREDRVNNSITPARAEQRSLSQADLALIWFGAAISISEIWAGGLGPLTALGLGAGLLAILLGRIVGNGLMAAMAGIGARTGLPTMVLTRAAFGRRGSYILSFFNIVQLVGWTGWMIFVAASYVGTLATTMGMQWGAPQWRSAAIITGVLCTLWALLFARQAWWKWVERVSSVLLLLLTVGMTGLILQSTDLNALTGTGSPLGILVGMDLVIAMSVSWLPLVADYSRFSKTAAGGGSGTFWGYFVGGTWMYAVGLLVALSTGSTEPEQMVVQTMAHSGLGWIVLAVALILLATVTTTFLDIYSAAISAQNLWPRLSARAGSIACGVLGTILALLLDVHGYAPFLIAIGAIFLPAFTVVLLDYWLRQRNGIEPNYTNTLLNWPAFSAWLVGFGVYDWAQGFPSLLTVYGGIARLTGAPVVNPAMPVFNFGASLPCIIVTAAVYMLLYSVFRKRG